MKKASQPSGLEQLCTLVKENKIDEIKKLVEQEKSLKGWSWKYTKKELVECAVRDAILLNQIETVQFFIDEGVSPSSHAYAEGDSGGMYNLIYFAASTGNLPMVKLLVEKGADIRPHNSYYKKGDDSAIREAVKGGYTDMVNYLLEKGAKSDGLCYGGSLGELNGGTTYLAKAAENRNIEMLQSLLKHGASITSAIYLADEKYNEKYPHLALDNWYSEEGRQSKIYSCLRYNSKIKNKLNQISELLSNINENSNKLLFDQLLPFIKICFPNNTNDQHSNQIDDLIKTIKQFEQEKLKIENEATNLRNDYQNMIQILLDYATGTDFPIEEKKYMGSGEYHGLTFLNTLDISGLNFIGVSIAGHPITREMLLQRKLKGAGKAIVTLEDLGNLQDKNRQTALLKNIADCQQKRGTLVTKNGVINLVPLRYAVQAGDINAVKTRLEAGIDPNSSEENTSPIILASKSGHFEIVKILAAHPKINKKDVVTAINDAKSKEIALYLTDLQDVDAIDTCGCTLLHKAVERKNIDDINKLILKKANVNIMDENGRTPLSIAASMEDKMGSTIVELLLNKGANANLYKWYSPLSKAVKADNPKSVALLLPYTEKKDIEEKDLWKEEVTNTIPWYVPLMFDALEKSNNIEILTLLRTAEADFSNESYGNILNNAIKLLPSFNDIVSTMQDLIRGGYNRHPEAMEKTYNDLNKRDHKYFEIASKLFCFLLKNGANIKLAEKDGYTPLHTLIKEVDLGHLKEGYQKFLELFVNSGADVNATTIHGKTPVHFAAESGDILALEFLAKHKANVNAMDKNKQTALHMAAAKGSPETVKKLIQLGADVDAKDSDNLTAFELCKIKEVKARNKEYYNHSTGDLVTREFDDRYLATLEMFNDKTLSPALEKEKTATSTNPLFFRTENHGVLPPLEIRQTDDSIKNENKLTVVFDIDDILAAHNETLLQNEKLYLLRKSAIIVAAKAEHQIFPGIIELMQYLYSKDTINVAFFSSGERERNVEFVKELLIKALGKERYTQIETSLIILSKQDLTPNNEKSNATLKMYKLHGGAYKKDIRKALGENALLRNAIFVDDNKTYVYCDQHKNFLCGRVGYVEYERYLNAEEDEQEKKKNFIRYNRAFYIAGVLSDCINSFQKGDDFRELLFNLQFKKSQDELFKYEFDYTPSDEATHYYEKGLEVLTQVNPKITFVSKEDYLTTLDNAITEQEQAILKVVERNASKRESCSIM